jgi:hypothetical protein
MSFLLAQRRNQILIEEYGKALLLGFFFVDCRLLSLGNSRKSLA